MQETNMYKLTGEEEDGSGPYLIGYFDDKDMAETVADDWERAGEPETTLEDLGWFVYRLSILPDIENEEIGIYLTYELAQAWAATLTSQTITWESHVSEGPMFEGYVPLWDGVHDEGPYMMFTIHDVAVVTELPESSTQDSAPSV